MLALKLTIQGAAKIKQRYDRISREEQKALTTAVKVEAYALRKTLQQEIRKGAPGGVALRSLSFIDRRLARSARPLRRLAMGVRYHVESREPYVMKVGWTGPGVSKSWKKLAEMHQEGFTRDVSEKQRRYLRRRGAELTGGKRKNPRAKYFFLKKTTTTMKTPARPIIDPFWRAHREEAWRSIRRNWKRKMAGERI